MLLIVVCCVVHIAECCVAVEHLLSPALNASRDSPFECLLTLAVSTLFAILLAWRFLLYPAAMVAEDKRQRRLSIEHTTSAREYMNACAHVRVQSSHRVDNNCPLSPPARLKVNRWHQLIIPKTTLLQQQAYSDLCVSVHT